MLGIIGAIYSQNWLDLGHLMDASFLGVPTGRFVHLLPEISPRHTFPIWSPQNYICYFNFGNTDRISPIVPKIILSNVDTDFCEKRRQIILRKKVHFRLEATTLFVSSS